MDFLSGLDWGTYYWFSSNPAPQLQRAALALATLGGLPVLTLLILLAVACLLAGRHGRSAAFLLMATLAGVAGGEGVWTMINRPPPAEPTVDWLNQPGAPADFPGGSPLAPAIVYLTLGLVAATLVRLRRLQGFLIGAAALMALLTAVARLYLGLLFVTDMLAAWVGGLAWALIARAVHDRWAGACTRDATL
jgi:undecaprenyl-diphosphatase